MHAIRLQGSKDPYRTDPPPAGLDPHLQRHAHGGTEFHWQDHHVEAVKGTLAIFPAGISHFHQGRVSHEHTNTIATGWIYAGRREDDLGPLASSPAPATPAR